MDGDGAKLKDILKQIETQMSGGRVIASKGGKTLSRQSSLVIGGDTSTLQRDESQESFGMSGLEVEAEGEEEDENSDARRWLKVVDAFEQPRLSYNTLRKNYET